MNTRDTDGYFALLFQQDPKVYTQSSLLVLLNQGKAVVDYFDDIGAYYGAVNRSTLSPDKIYDFRDNNLFVGTVSMGGDRVVNDFEAYALSKDFFFGRLDIHKHSLLERLL
jgi:hypothetical protein